MKYTNRDIILKIAKKPEAANVADKEFVALTDSTSTITHNISVTKQDMKYYGNGGETTSLITGRQQSLTISLDYDDEDEAHKYLMELNLNSDCMKANNQYIMLEPKGGIKKKIYGKCCFQFKTGSITGAVDEVKKLEFDIFPQDKAFTIEDVVANTINEEVKDEANS